MTTFRVLVGGILLAALAVFISVGMVVAASTAGEDLPAGEPVTLPSGDRVFVHGERSAQCIVASPEGTEVDSFTVGWEGTRSPYGLTGRYLRPTGSAVVECDRKVTIILDPGPATALASRPLLALAPFGLLFCLLLVANRVYRRARPTDGASETFGAPKAAPTEPMAPVFTTSEPASSESPTSELSELPVLADDTIRVTWSLNRTDRGTFNLTGVRGARARLLPKHSEARGSLPSAISRTGRPGSAMQVWEETPTDKEPSAAPALFGTLITEPGRGTSFECAAINADGTVAARAVAHSRFLNPFPDIELSGHAGEPLGLLTGAANRKLLDPQGQVCGSVRIAAPEQLSVINREMAIELRFAPEVPAPTRVAVLAGWFGAECVRTD